MNKVCKVCGGEGTESEKLYEIYNNDGWIHEMCMDDSYGECCICRKEGKRIAYKIGSDLIHDDRDDKDYCENHYDGGGPLNEEEEDLIEYYSK